MAKSQNGSNNHYLLSAIGGGLLCLLGIMALNSTVVTSFATVYVLGWILLLGGIFEFFLSFTIPNGGGIFLGMIFAVLSFVLGGLMILNPGASLSTLTLLLAMYFVVSGIVDIATSFTTNVVSRGWSLTYGVALLILGIAVWSRFPTSSYHFFGIFIGISLLLYGARMVATSATPPHVVTHKTRFA